MILWVGLSVLYGDASGWRWRRRGQVTSRPLKKAPLLLRLLCGDLFRLHIDAFAITSKKDSPNYAAF